MMIVRSAVLVCLLSAACQAQSLFRNGDAFRGAVHAVRSERVMIVKEGSSFVEGPSILFQEKKYSPDGRTSETVSYTPTGGIREKRTDRYTADGHLLTYEIQNGSGEVIQRSVYTYDDKGWQLSETKYDGDGAVIDKKFTQPTLSEGRLTSTLTTNQSGRVVESAVNNKDSAGTSTWDRQLPDGGREVSVYSRFVNGKKHDEQFLYNPDGSLKNKMVTDVFDNGARFETSIYDGSGKLQSKAAKTREHDSQGNLIKLSEFRWNTEANNWEPVSISYNKIAYYQ